MNIQYLAGIMDADGTFYISKGYTPTVKLEVRERGFLKEIQSFYGGSLSKERVRNGQAPTSTLAWRVTNKEQMKFLKLIIPHLKIKARQACLCLCIGIDNWLAVKENRELTYRSCKALNEKGVEKEYDATKIYGDRRHALEKLAWSQLLREPDKNSFDISVLSQELDGGDFFRRHIPLSETISGGAISVEDVPSDAQSSPGFYPTREPRFRD